MFLEKNMEIIWKTTQQIALFVYILQYVGSKPKNLAKISIKSRDEHILGAFFEIRFFRKQYEKLVLIGHALLIADNSLKRVSKRKINEKNMGTFF